MCKASKLIHREIRSLEDSIARLEKRLQTETPTEPLSQGNRALLALFQEERAWLVTLLPCVDTTEHLHTECLRRLCRALEHHQQISQNGGAHDLRHADAWWHSLKIVEFYAALLHRLHELSEPLDENGSVPRITPEAQRYLAGS